MKPLTPDELQTLLGEAETTDGPCISIYLPTVRAGVETQQNPIRFKNQLRAAERELEERGIEPEELLGPLHELEADFDFWQHQDEGLALFRTPGFLRCYQVPVPFEELVAINDHFYLKPLFRLLSGDGRFLILGLSLNNVRLFEASRYSVRELELGPDVPRSLADALGHETEEQHLQYHTGTATSGPAPGAGAGRKRAPAGGGAERTPIYHGHGGGEEDRNAEIAKFFHVVDRELHDRLREHDLPLVLAGVEYLQPIYREASTFPRLVDGGVPGNPDDLRPDQLHEKALEVVKPTLLAGRKEALEQFADLSGSERAVDRIDDVVTAAFDGRVDTLFVARGEHRWGSFDPAERKVEVDGRGPGEARSEGQEDLLDFAAVRTFMNGGRVFELDPADLPTKDEPLAAILRY